MRFHQVKALSHLVFLFSAGEHHCQEKGLLLITVAYCSRQSSMVWDACACQLNGCRSGSGSLGGQVPQWIIKVFSGSSNLHLFFQSSH